MGHVLSDCYVAHRIWEGVGIPSSVVNSFSTSPPAWLKFNCASKTSHRSGIPWNIIFPFVCWNIWNLRNKTLFQPNGTPIRDAILATVQSSLSQATEWNFIVIPDLVPRSKDTVLIKWCPPPTSCFKLNTDGSCKKDASVASGGGLIRDMHGNWIIGFHRTMRPMQSLEAELWTLRDGLQLALDRKITQIYVEMDALAAVQLIMGVDQPRHFLSNIVHDCRFLMRKLGVEKIDHIYREGNKCADALANMACNPILDIAPACINSQLRDDAYGVSYPRLLYVS